MCGRGLRGRLSRVAPFGRTGRACAASVLLAASANAQIAAPAALPGQPAAGPGAGSGQRHVQSESPPEAAQAAPAKASAPAAPAHRRGPAPRQPAPTLPPGAEARPRDETARRLVAGGPTEDDVAAGADDPELRELKEAERVLFPKPLKGMTPGWSWQLPGAGDDSGRVEDSGLPPSGRTTARDAGASDAPDAAWLKRLALPNVPVRFDAHVVKYLEFYKNDPRGRRIARAWAKKSGRLIPALKAEFARAGLPTDLVWLSLIESGHNPTILSPVGAAGLWQFMPESARMYGLNVDRWVDERLDPERSTEAAITYLKDLRSRFGGWELAMAAYNMGHAGLLRAVRKFNTNDFWLLSRYEGGVPWETTLYVPKICAIAIVMENRKAFGIDDVIPEAAVSFDTVYVDQGVPLSEVARAGQTSEDEVARLNAHYLAGRTPPTPRGAKAKRWPVRLPSGSGVTASRAFETSKSRSEGTDRYVVRFGDTLESIAAERGTTEEQLRRLNHVAGGERIETGTILVVPGVAPDGRVSAAAPAKPVAVVPARRFNYPDRRRVFYRVLAGDSVGRIARAFGVKPSELITWNALDDSAHLQTDMTLQVFVNRSDALSKVRHFSEQETRVLVAGTDEFFEYFEALNGRKRITIAAQEGETLAGIGRRYGMSTGMMERINQFSRTRKLRAGERVVVYARGASQAQTPAPGRASLPQVEPPRPEALPPLDVRSAGKASNGERSLP